MPPDEYIDKQEEQANKGFAYFQKCITSSENDLTPHISLRFIQDLSDLIYIYHNVLIHTEISELPQKNHIHTEQQAELRKKLIKQTHTIATIFLSK